MKNLLKTSVVVFFDKRYFRFLFYLISKNGFIVFEKVLLSVMSFVFNITKEVFLFTPDQVYTKITLLVICLSINVTFCI